MFLLLKKAIRLPATYLGSAQLLDTLELRRSWLRLCLASLLLSGLFSFVIVLARTPGIAGFITDPEFARKSLVLHVNLALVVWFYSFLALLTVSVTGHANRTLHTLALILSAAGVLMMIATLFIPGVDPVLANYIPVLDHPLFISGLILFGSGLIMMFVVSSMAEPVERSGRLSELRFPGALLAIRFAAAIVAVALITFLLAGAVTPRVHGMHAYYERVMWGGGHILQFANVLGMLTVWFVMVRKVSGSDLASPGTHRLLLTLLAMPALLSPFLLLAGTTSDLYYRGFTTLMRWFIFPVVSLYLLMAIYTLWINRTGKPAKPDTLKRLCLNGFAASAVLTVIGFLLGAMIRGSNTLVPAHYHASLGGVTVAYMVMVFLLMRAFGYRLNLHRYGRMLRMQPLLFGFGQAIFVAGFAWAGLSGTGRKIYGGEQTLHSMEAVAGLALMSVGGLMAITGGLLFLYLVLRQFTNKPDTDCHG